MHGTIGFRTAGALPARAMGQGLLPLDGSDPATHWQGLVPADQMPKLSNPPAGFLAAANARVNARHDGPLVSADNAPPYRIARIQQVLAGKQALTVADMQALQMDWTDGQARQVLPSLLRQLDPTVLSPAADAVLPMLHSWAKDPTASRDSGGALLFQQWYLDIAATVFTEATAELYPRLLKRSYLLNHALDHLILHAPYSPWWRGKQGALLGNALNTTVETISAKQGPDSRAWRLNRQLKLRMQHELGKTVPQLGWLFNRPDQAWGGSTATVGRARYSYARPFVVQTGATVRAVAEMGAVPRVWSVIPGGQSGHPLSRHYADQYRGWLEGELYPIAAEPELVAGAALRLEPE